MYSVFCLGLVMILEGFGAEVPEFVTPVITIAIITGFFLKSKVYAKNHAS